MGGGGRGEESNLYFTFCMSRAEMGSAETETKVQMLWEQGEALQNGCGSLQMMYEMQTICCEPWCAELGWAPRCLLAELSPGPAFPAPLFWDSSSVLRPQPFLPLVSSQKKVLHTVGAQPMQQTSLLPSLSLIL